MIAELDLKPIVAVVVAVGGVIAARKTERATPVVESSKFVDFVDSVEVEVNGKVIVLVAVSQPNKIRTK